MRPKPFAFMLFFLIAAAPDRSSIAQAPAEPAAPPSAAEGGQVLGLDSDKWERMTVPVSIGGRGPFRFVVDTGAERTVIARELAEELKLPAGRRARVHSMTEVSSIPTVIIPELSVAGRETRSIHAPALERRNLGAEGILGIDTLQKQRILFDFGRQEMLVAPSRQREPPWPDDTIVVTARSKFGHLVLVDASVNGQKVWVIVDTGAQITIGNNMLRSRLERKGLLGEIRPVGIFSVTGGKAVADETRVKKLRIGGVDIRDLPIAFADVHPFRQLDLLRRPAILLGMDVLRMFDRVSVDFASRRVRLLAPEGTETRRGYASRP